MVETIIYYFSGTGNSLDVARHIGEQLGNSVLISMSENPYEIRQKSSQMVGFVYPVYYEGMPRAVEEFIQRIRMVDDLYVFAVATGKGKPGNALKQINQLFQSMEYQLSYGAFLKTADNNIIEQRERQNTVKRIANSYAELKRIIEEIKERKVNQLGISNPLSTLYHQNCLKRAMEWYKQFQVSDDCTHCGICYRICPVGNIELVDGKPLFHHHCEACMACIQFCPVNALNYKKRTVNRERYHHPSVSASDLFCR